MKRLLNLGSRVSCYSNVWLLTHVAPLKVSYGAEISSASGLVRARDQTHATHLRTNTNDERLEVDGRRRDWIALLLPVKINPRIYARRCRQRTSLRMANRERREGWEVIDFAYFVKLMLDLASPG
jgi:hypothetical protein